MVKKLFSILFLTTIAIASLCMETENITPPNPWFNDFKHEFDRLALNNNQDAIIKFLDDRGETLTDEEFCYVIAQTHLKNSQSKESFARVINHLNREYEFDTNHKLIAAINSANRQKVTQLTNFKDYITFDGQFMKDDYYNHLTEMGLDASLIKNIQDLLDLHANPSSQDDNSTTSYDSNVCMPNPLMLLNDNEPSKAMPTETSTSASNSTLDISTQTTTTNSVIVQPQNVQVQKKRSYFNLKTLAMFSLTVTVGCYVSYRIFNKCNNPKIITAR